MFYGRFKMIVFLPNTDQDVCILKYITYLHEMSLHPYRPRFLQLSMTNGNKYCIAHHLICNCHHFLATFWVQLCSVLKHITK